MIGTVVAITSKYWTAALFGAASKTAVAYHKKKTTKLVLLRDFLLNSLFAILVGSYAAHLFFIEFPEKEHFSYPVAYFAGAVGTNLITGLMSINWQDAIEKRLGGKND